MSQRFKSVLLVLMLTAFLTLGTVGTAFGATSGGTGDDRWVELVVDDATVDAEYETTVNLTVPEVIHDSYELTGTFAQVRATGYNGSINTTLTIVFSNATDVTTTYYWYANSTVANATATVSIVTSLAAGTYNVTSVKLSDDGAGADDEYTDGLNVTVMTESSWLIGHYTVQLLFSLLPIIVIFIVIIPILMSVMKDIDKDTKKV